MEQTKENVPQIELTEAVQAQLEAAAAQEETVARFATRFAMEANQAVEIDPTSQTVPVIEQDQPSIEAGQQPAAETTAATVTVS